MKRYAYFLTLIGSAAVLTAAASVASALDEATKEPAVSKRLAASHVAVGDRLTAGKHFDYARSEYSAAAKLARAAGQLPVLPVRRIANAYYFEGDYRSAATVLDELASEAGAGGDVLTQIWATADAAWLAGLADDERGVSERLEKVRSLLETADLSAAARALVEEKLEATDYMAFAPHLASW